MKFLFEFFYNLFSIPFLTKYYMILPGDYIIFLLSIIPLCFIWYKNRDKEKNSFASSNRFVMLLFLIINLIEIALLFLSFFIYASLISWSPNYQGEGTQNVAIFLICVPMLFINSFINLALSWWVSLSRIEKTIPFLSTILICMPIWFIYFSAYHHIQIEYTPYLNYIMSTGALISFLLFLLNIVITCKIFYFYIKNRKSTHPQ